jgi:hypothetical protein
MYCGEHPAVSVVVACAPEEADVRRSGGRAGVTSGSRISVLQLEAGLAAV